MGVCMPFFPASQCTPHVLEATKTSCSPGKKNWSQTIYLPRRHALNGLIQRLSRKTYQHCSQPVIQPRFCVKRGEVYLSTHTRTRVPRLSGKFNHNVFVPPKGQVKEYQEGVSDYDKQPLYVNQKTVSTLGKTVLFNTSSFSSTPALPLSSDGQNNGFEETTSYKSTLSEPGNSRRAPLVVRSLSCLKWQTPSEKERQSLDRDRCFKPRLGCVLQWGKNKGNLVSSGMFSVHKLFRINSRRFCNKILLQKQSLSPSKAVDGQ